MKAKLKYIYLYFFFLSISAGAYIPFVSIYIYELGYSAFQLGIISSIVPAVAMVAQPIIGKRADIFNNARLICIILLLVESVSIFVLIYVSNIFVITIFMCLITTANGSVFSISLAVLLGILKNHNKINKYGVVRLSYTIGFAFIGFILGLISDLKVSFAFFISSIFAILTIFPLKRFISESYQMSEKKIVKIIEIIKNRKLLFFLFISFLLCCSNGFFNIYLPLLFKKLGANNNIYSISIFIMTFSEIPMLLLFSTIYKKNSLEKIMFIPLISILLRSFFISIATHSLILLVTNVLHAGGFIVIQMALTQYANDNVNKDLKVTTQTIVTSVIYSLSRIVSGFLGGIIIKKFNIETLFNWNFTFSLVVFLLYIVLYVYSSVRKRQVS